MVTFMANSLAFPYGDPETAAVEVLVLSDDEDGDCGTAQRNPPTRSVHALVRQVASIGKVIYNFYADMV